MTRVGPWSGVRQLNSVDDQLILQKCCKGSREAFETIVNRYMKDAYFIALGFVGNSEDAMDLSQEAFIRAYNNIKKLNPAWGFFPWFYQILKNLCFNHLKKSRRNQQASLDEFIDKGVEPCDGFAPDVIAENNETKQMVWKAIGQLDEKHREIIILRHFRGLSYERISKILFCSEGTVMSRLYYARRKLKDILTAQKGGQLQ